VDTLVFFLRPAAEFVVLEAGGHVCGVGRPGMARGLTPSSVTA